MPRSPFPASAECCLALEQASRDGLLSLSCHSSRGRRLSRRDSNLDFLQDTLQEKSPELRSLHFEKMVGRGSFGRVYKGELSNA